MEVTWAIICESAVTDQETNNISLFNLLDEMQLPEPPDPATEQSPPVMAAVQLLMVALFSRSDLERGEKEQARITINFPTAIEAQALPTFEIDLENAHRLRAKFNIAGFPVAGEGIYHFRIQQLNCDGDWSDLYEVPLQVSYLLPD